MSLAPDPLRIGLGRLFTSPGVDPYDEVVWERRDARITNFSDGSVGWGAGDRSARCRASSKAQEDNRSLIIRSEFSQTVVLPHAYSANGSGIGRVCAKCAGGERFSPKGYATSAVAAGAGDAPGTLRSACTNAIVANAAIPNNPVSTMIHRAGNVPTADVSAVSPNGANAELN